MKFVALATLMALPLGAADARAQSASALSGRVTDPTGGAIEGAKVEVSGPAQRATTSSSGGVYQLGGLAPGSYTLIVTKSRFSPFAQSGVTLSAGSVATLDVQLALAPREEQVVVESEVSLGLDARDSAGAIVIRGEDLEALPDDPDELAEALQALAGPAAGPSGGQMFIDGFAGGQLPPKASIREIRINSNPFSAEFDRLGFGRIEVLTKPGTERLRGQGSFEFMDESLNSRNPFASNQPPYQRRDFGAELGGSLKAKKASFHVSASRRDVDDNELVNTTILDSALNPVSYGVGVLSPQHRTMLNPRLDLQISERHTLVARYSYMEFERLRAGVGEFSLPSRAFDTSNQQHLLQLTETAMLSGKLVNETRVQITQDRREQRGDNSVPTIQVLDAFTGGGSQVGLSHTEERRLELQNVTTWSYGKHALRAGVRARRVQIEDVSRNNFGGSLTFAGGAGPLLDAQNQPLLGPDGRPTLVPLTSLERYRRTLLFQGLGLSGAQVRALGGGASQFRIAGGDPRAEVTQWDVAPFVQDDWRATSNLTLSVGLRYENQANVDSHWNLAPRVAFAWSPKKKPEDRPKTVVRGGFGVFYDRVGEDLTLQEQRFDGVSQQQFLVTAPALLDRIQFTPDGLSDLPRASELAGFALPQITRRLAGDLQTPVTSQLSLSVERVLPGNFTFSGILVSTRTRRMLRSRNVNAPLPGSGERPLARPDAVYQYESTGRLDQQQLILGLNNRMSRSLSLFARYFLGRTKSDTDAAGSFPASSYDLDAEYGWASFDVRHRFVLGGSLRLPWDVRVSPFVIASSGRPFNITTGRDNNGDSIFNDRPAYASDPQKPGVVSTPYGLLDPNPAPGQAAIPRNLGRGPSFLMINLRVMKTFGFGKRPQAEGEGGEAAAAPRPAGPVVVAGGPGGRPPGGPGGEGRGGGGRFGGFDDAPRSRVSLSVSLNVQNLLNRVNAGPPVGNLSSPLFGRSLATAGGFGFGPGGGGGGGGSGAGNRRIELQARLAF